MLKLPVIFKLIDRCPIYNTIIPLLMYILALVMHRLLIQGHFYLSTQNIRFIHLFYLPLILLASMSERKTCPIAFTYNSVVFLPRTMFPAIVCDGGVIGREGW